MKAVLILFLTAPLQAIIVKQPQSLTPSDPVEFYLQNRRETTGVLPDKALPDNEYYTQTLKLIKDSCGQACENVTPDGPGKYFDTVSKPDQCSALFSEKMMVLDGLSNRWPPPQDIPKPMFDAFTLNDPEFKYDKKYKLDAPNAKKKNNRKQGGSSWAKDDVMKNVANFAKGDFSVCSYSAAESKALYDAAMMYKDELAGKHCAVLGSQSPWLESILLAAGVAKITTIEYSDINSTHPAIDSMHPSDWDQFHNQGKKFDCLWSYSSLEHAGLGRYGDIVNPWGDYIAMGKLSCTTKPGGLIMIGMPMKDATATQDSIAWNAHRYYGPRRWAQMLANTEQLYFSEGKDTWHQGFVIARKL